MKHLIKRLLKNLGDLKGKLQAGKIFGVFDGHDGLTGNTHGLGQIFLGHLGSIKT